MKTIMPEHMALWQSVNFQPGIGWEEDPFYKDKICPHFELICQAAALLGIERKTLLKKKEFCGRWMTMTAHTVTPSGPTTECERIAEELDKLIQQAELAAENPLIPNPNGRFHLVIDCAEVELSGKLLKLQERLAGRIPLANLTLQMMELHPGKFQPNESLKILRAAKGILKHLVIKTIGRQSTTFKTYHQYSVYILTGKAKKESCKLHPNIDH